MTETLLLVITLVAVAAATALAALRLSRARRDARRVRDLEAQVSRMRTEVELANGARSAFFDLVTHELRSPLAAVLGYQELLEDGAYGPLDPPAADAVRRIGRSGSHLLHLIDGVVEIARIRSGTVEPNVEEVIFTAVAAEALEKFAASALEREIHTRIRTPADPIVIRSDPERLVRALDVLLTSAVKYPGDDAIGVDVVSEGDGASVLITGIEIGADHDSPSLASRLGMRLTVADSIAGLLGGHLELETDHHGTVRGLAFHVADIPAPADPGL